MILLSTFFDLHLIHEYLNMKEDFFEHLSELYGFDNAL